MAKREDQRKLAQKNCVRCSSSFRSLPKHNDRQHCNDCHTFLVKKARKPEKRCRGCDGVLPDRRADFCGPCRPERRRTGQRVLRRRNAPECVSCGEKIYRAPPGRSRCFVCLPTADRQRTYSRKYCKERKSLDPEYALRMRIIYRMRSIRGALKIGGGSRNLFAELGYSFGELREHMERKFSPGMTWEKFAAGEIHLDHERPVASFDWRNDFERSLSECWALSNLQPLWSTENFKKGAKWKGRDCRKRAATCLSFGG
jgi:ribosomal protein S27AE